MSMTGIFKAYACRSHPGYARTMGGAMAIVTGSIMGFSGCSQQGSQLASGSSSVTSVSTQVDNPAEHQKACTALVQYITVRTLETPSEAAGKKSFHQKELESASYYSALRKYPEAVKIARDATNNPPYAKEIYDGEKAFCGAYFNSSTTENSQHQGACQELVELVGYQQMRYHSDPDLYASLNSTDLEELKHSEYRFVNVHKDPESMKIGAAVVADPNSRSVKRRVKVFCGPYFERDVQAGLTQWSHARNPITGQSNSFIPDWSL